MTMVKVTSEGKSTSAQRPRSGKKADFPEGNLKFKIPRYVIVAFFGVLAAFCVALLLDYQKPQGNSQLVSSTPQQSEIEEQPVPYCGNADDFNYSYGQVIAIEFGETYSRVGAPVSDGMEIFYHDGQPQTPNYVTYTDKGVLVGQEAKDQALANPKNTIFDVRRIIGRRLSNDPSLQSDIDSLPYDVVIKDDQPFIKLLRHGKEKLNTPEEVSGEIMKKMKAAAVEYYGKDIKFTIMTVPAYFNDHQRQAVKDAARYACLDVLRLVNGPTAASLGHGIDHFECRNVDCEDFIVVYNLGEKNVDVTATLMDTGVFEILGSTGDRASGGQNLDDALFKYVIEEFQQRTDNTDLTKDIHLVERLKVQVQEVEHKLLTKASATIQVDAFSLIVTRGTLEGLHKNIFSRSIKHIEAALSQAKIQKTNITHIVLTGNPGQVLKIQPFFEDFFGGMKVLSKVPSDQAVLRGAVHQAEIFSGEAETDWVGAFDVTALSMGIETVGGLYTKIIPRNMVIPTRRSVNVTTIHDGQSKIVVNIFEGERPFVVNNKIIETLELADLPTKPAGELLIEISFELDVNSVLKVTAREMETGKEKIFWANSDLHSRYDGVNLDAVIMEAETFAEEDSEKRTAVVNGLVVKEGSEFGIALVLREDEKPVRWY